MVGRKGEEGVGVELRERSKSIPQPACHEVVPRDVRYKGMREITASGQCKPYTVRCL